MVNFDGFKLWLSLNTTYSNATISNTISRFKRADTILPWFDDVTYLFHLELNKEFQKLSCSVRSQIKKAVKQYIAYVESEKTSSNDNANSMKYHILSLFSNIGVAEAYLEKDGFDIAVANELIERRATLYSRIYPNTKMICGDITQYSVFEQIIEESKKRNVNIIMATPPCQGMSTAGQQNEDDYRNTLICPVINAIQRIMPKYVFLENVPMFLKTTISVNGNKTLITDLIRSELAEQYIIREYVIDTKDYGVPQTRERAIILMTKKDAGIVEWLLPAKSSHKVTMRDAIGHLPPLDPFVTDVSNEELLDMFPDYYQREKEALKISPWHKPPHHVKRQVVVMQHTPSGCTAFDNEVYFPVKENGEPVKGYHNTYKRQNWDTAAYTVTMDNRKISSQNNVHPGRLIGKDKDGIDVYSDPRTLTLYELMIIMSLPSDWAVPTNTSEAFLRRIIGEGIPPLFVKKVFENIK